MADSLDESRPKLRGDTSFLWEESFAKDLDDRDPLAAFRDQFHIPRRSDGSSMIYFCGNSLGLQPKAARQLVEQEMEDWARLAVDGHFHGSDPWYPYHESLREPGARLVGALPTEVVHMNGLTVNLHLMMVSFYRPTQQRFKILIEDCAFPSDTYAVRTQIRLHHFDPDQALLVAKPRPGEHAIRQDDLRELLALHGPSIALVLLGGVNYYTGQAFDMAAVSEQARRLGCVVGLDLAHAAGNVELALHDWNVDFAAWCTYKYLNSGPGAVAGCFVHERHLTNPELPRFGGWWGNDPNSRFRMHLEPEFRPVPSADAWQLSNPPILAMAPLKASLALFDRAGMAALRKKSQELTGYLQSLLDTIDQAPSRLSRLSEARRYEVITPRTPSERGCQLSILVHDRPKERHAALESKGVVCDFREPNVIRVAPVPMYNTFHEVWRLAQVLVDPDGPR